MKLSTSMTTGELIEAINEFNQLAESLKNEEARSEMFVDIVRRSAQALGKPFEGRGSSWHDVPECIAALTARVEELRLKVLAMPSGKCDADWVAGELAAALKEAGQA